MSSGVDSSVAAVLLKKSGYEVIGIYLRLWKNRRGAAAFGDEAAARLLAKKIGIGFKVIDARRTFKGKVVKYFLDGYRSGRTPNPCVFCNENIKFPLLFEAMEKYGADYVATGHYARIKPGIDKNIPPRLLVAADKNKDQSYFLYRLKGRQLKKIIFPIGDFQKEKVRLLAKDWHLPIWKKDESQDICFLAGQTVEEFLKDNLRMRPGKIKNSQGAPLGKHAGLPLYTKGQRKGLNIGGDGPYYVIKKETQKNALIVTNEKKGTALFSQKASLKKINWVAARPVLPARLLMRIRYRNPLIYGTIEDSRGANITFEKPQWAVTPGQSIVFYSKNGDVIGGGIIK